MNGDVVTLPFEVVYRNKYPTEILGGKHHIRKGDRLTVVGVNIPAGGEAVYEIEYYRGMRFLVDARDFDIVPPKPAPMLSTPEDVYRKNPMYGRY